MTLTHTEHHPENKLPWPYPGQRFVVYIAAIKEGDKVLLEFIRAPTVVMNVVSSGFFIDETQFSDGLWKCELEYVHEKLRDLEGGGCDDDYGFDVRTMVKL